MKNKVLILLILLFIILAFIFVGLSLSKQDAPEPPTDNDVVLVWWNVFEPIENIQPLIDAYRVKNPKVTIQYINKDISSYKDDLDNTLNDDVAINTPDIFAIHNSWTGKYRQYGIKSPDNVLTDTVLEDFYPIVKDDFYDNGIYGLPMYLDSIAIIYDNKKFVQKGYEAPSKLWSDFILQVATLTERNKDKKITYAGFSAYLPDNCQFAFEMINLLLLQNGVQVLDSGGNSQLEKQSAAYGAFMFYKSAVDNEGSGLWSSDMKKDIAAFLEGKLAVYPAPSWRLVDILNYKKQYNLNLDVKVAQIPQLSGSLEVFWPTYWGLMVSKETRHSQEAWEFIKFITEAEQLKLLDQTVKANGRPIGIIYPRISMYELNKDDQYLGVYATSLRSAKIWKMRDGFEMKKIFDQALKENWDLKKLDTSINSVISKK